VEYKGFMVSGERKYERRVVGYLLSVEVTKLIRWKAGANNEEKI